MAVFQAGSPIGVLLGLAFGGVIAGAFGWRMAFVCAGVPGIFLSLFVFFVLEDPSREYGPVPATERVPMRDVVLELRSKPSFWFLAGGAALGALVTYSQGAFIASFFLRLHGRELAILIPGLTAEGAIGLILGLILGLGGLTGMALGGIVGDHGNEASLPRYMTVAAWSSIAVAPPFVAAMLVPSLKFSLACFIPSAIIGAAWGPPTWATLARLPSPRSRATIIATALLIVTLVGLGIGPLSVGAISDQAAKTLGSAEGLRIVLMSTAASSVLSGILFLLARRTIGRDATLLADNEVII